MDTTKREQVQLFGELNAIIETERLGQEMPSRGDAVRVRAKIILPKSPSDRWLHEELRFELRLAVGLKPLYKDWGFDSSEGRYCGDVFTGRSYPATERRAMAWAREEVARLRAALEQRAVALVEAERDFDDAAPETIPAASEEE